MDFFAHQEEAQRITRRLVVLFALAVVAIVVAVYLAVAVLLFGAGINHPEAQQVAGGVWQPELFLVVTIGTLLVIAGGSGFKTLQLRAGGPAVARLLGGRQVDPNTTDPAERRLRNVVEEMALASGLPVPDVYVLDRESGINAFAAGHSPSDAVITVTDGTLHLLSRDELQGVVAHEFSHILHGDMRLDLRLMGLVFGILAISSIGYILMRSGVWGGGRRRNKGGGLVLVGLALYVIGWIGVFFGRLIKAAVSRQREFLADASAVQYTRNPAGIAGALKKIGGYSGGSRVKSGHAEEASHLFFADGLAARWFGLTATHPPLQERIRRIDPSFDGTFPDVRWPEDEAETPPAAAAMGARGRSPVPPIVPSSPTLPGAAGVALAGAAALAGGGRGGPVPGPADFAAAAGTVAPVHLAWAAALLDGLPEPLAKAAREPSSARALVYALLLDPSEEVRTRQREAMEREAAPEAVAETARLWRSVEQVGRSARLPLADLALPALRSLTPDQYRRFRRTVTLLAEADHRIDLFEYALKRMILRNLEPRFAAPAARGAEAKGGAEGAPGGGVQYYALRKLSAEVSCLLSTLAWSGTGDPEAAAGAVEAGAAELRGLVQVRTLDSAACRLSAVDDALDRLAQVTPRLRRRLLQAAVAAVVHDRQVTTAEAELLRAVADGLGCPVPPMLVAATA